MKNMFHGQVIFCIKFLVVSDFDALFNDEKEADISDRCGLPLNVD